MNVKLNCTRAEFLEILKRHTKSGSPSYTASPMTIFSIFSVRNQPFIGIVTDERIHVCRYSGVLANTFAINGSFERSEGHDVLSITTELLPFFKFVGTMALIGFLLPPIFYYVNFHDLKGTCGMVGCGLLPIGAAAVLLYFQRKRLIKEFLKLNEKPLR